VGGKGKDIGLGNQKGLSSEKSRQAVAWASPFGGKKREAHDQEDQTLGTVGGSCGSAGTKKREGGFMIEPGKEDPKQHSTTGVRKTIRGTKNEMLDRRAQNKIKTTPRGRHRGMGKKKVRRSQLQRDRVNVKVVWRMARKKKNEKEWGQKKTEKSTTNKSSEGLI